MADLRKQHAGRAGGAGAGGGCGGRRRSDGGAQAGGSTRGDAGGELARKILVYLDDDQVDEDLGLGLIEVQNDLFSEVHLVAGAADDERVLRIDGEDQAEVAHRAHRGHDLLQLGGRGDVGQVEDARDLVLVVAAFGHGFLGDEDGIGRDGLPEGVGQQGDVIQGLLERAVLEIQGKLLVVRHQLGIEQDVDGSHCTDRVVERFHRLVRDLEVERLGGGGAQLRRSQHG